MLRRLAAARAMVPHLPDKRVRTAPLSETTIQRVTAVLRAALNDCKALKVNPAAGIELRVPKRKPIVWTPERVTRWRESGGTWRPGPVMVWTPQQTGEFLDAIEDDRLYPLYSLAAFAGLRRAEVAGLPWSEIDLDGGLITVRETRPDDDADPDDPKSEAGDRTVALSASWSPCSGRGGSGSSRSAWRGAPRGLTAAWCSPARMVNLCGPATSASTSGCSCARPGCRPSGSTTCATEAPRSAK